MHGQQNIFKKLNSVFLLKSNVYEPMNNRHIIWETYDSHSGVAEKWSLLGCYAVSLR